MQNATLNFNFALNEALSLTFEGVLTSAVTFALQWTEPRLTWNVSSDFQHWNWPTKIDINPAKLWLPVYFIHNCPDTSCSVSIDKNTEIDIQNDGTISLLIMTVIDSTCHLNLDLFPFDEQTCSVIFDLDNSIPITYNIVTENLGSALFYEDSDEWLVTALSYSKRRVTSMSSQ